MKPAALADTTGAIRFRDLRRPSSNFDFIEEEFEFSQSSDDIRASVVLRRLFSEARRHKAITLIVEEIKPQGVLAAENREIRRSFKDYTLGGLRRLSFWQNRVGNVADLGKCDSKKLIGYLIVKKDIVPSKASAKWHVFESVFRKYGHINNCVPNQPVYRLKVANRVFEISGVLYGQQNGLNKACAQVALRSLLSLHFPLEALTYEKINALARGKRLYFNPSEGLSARAIQSVLRGFGVEFSQIDYSRFTGDDVRRDIPYQKYVYAGVESGAGALLGFRMSLPNSSSHHIVAFFGHTFNQDTWVPRAASAYFRVGSKTRYIPSERWVSSFIGHDDNFGSNFCVPRLYVAPKNAQYAVALLPFGVKYDGLKAEAIASDYFYSLQKDLGLANSRNKWVRRLLAWAGEQEVVLRSVAMTKAQYLCHLERIRDWRNKREVKFILNVFRSSLPSHLWVVEISLPELFPINRRKLGEIVLDATKRPNPTRDYKTFLFARFPGNFFFIKRIQKNDSPEFLSLPSDIESHTPLLIKSGGPFSKSNTHTFRTP